METGKKKKTKYKNKFPAKNIIQMLFKSYSKLKQLIYNLVKTY